MSEKSTPKLIEKRTNFSIEKKIKNIRQSVEQESIFEGHDVVIFGHDTAIGNELHKLTKQKWVPHFIRRDYLVEDEQLKDTESTVTRKQSTSSEVYDWAYHFHAKLTKIKGYHYPTLSSVNVYENPKQVHAYLNTIRPSVIINLFDYDNLNGTQDSLGAWNCNYRFVKELVKYCSENGSHLIHLSDARVFNSVKQPLPFKAYDTYEKNPANMYGIQKYMAEKEVLTLDIGTSGTAEVVRIGQLMSSETGLLNGLLKALKERNPLLAVHDNLWSPSHASNVAKYIYTKIKTLDFKPEKEPDTSRVYLTNIVDEVDPVDTYTFACYLKKKLDQNGYPYTNEEINKATTDYYRSKKKLVDELPIYTPLKHEPRWINDPVYMDTNDTLNHYLFEYDMMQFEEYVQHAIKSMFSSYETPAHNSEGTDSDPSSINLFVDGKEAAKHKFSINNDIPEETKEDTDSDPVNLMLVLAHIEEVKNGRPFMRRKFLELTSKLSKTELTIAMSALLPVANI